MYAHVYIHICIYVYTYIYIYIHTEIDTCTYTYTYTCYMCVWRLAIMHIVCWSDLLLNFERECRRLGSLSCGFLGASGGKTYLILCYTIL